MKKKKTWSVRHCKTGNDVYSFVLKPVTGSLKSRFFYKISALFMSRDSDWKNDVEIILLA